MNPDVSRKKTAIDCRTIVNDMHGNPLTTQRM